MGDKRDPSKESSGETSADSGSADEKSNSSHQDEDVSTGFDKDVTTSFDNLVSSGVKSSSLYSALARIKSLFMDYDCLEILVG